MNFAKKSSLTIIAALAVVFSFSTFSFAKSHNSEFPNIKISNFGQMDENFYRGARPKAEDFQSLAALGIKTVIDLTDNSREREEPAVIAAGMHYVNIPIVDKSYPTAESVSEFLKVVNNPATGKFYVHCAGGRHRTGIMGAVYRFNHDHWTFDQAYAEMKQYDFYTSNGHGKQLDFIQDYWQQFQASHNGGSAVAVTSGR
ncbi:MAG TPA: tyrosine-protein phosphatase [Pyrinomonadaceae bacterium]|nr:tyrosine-protein phosphatase [Pyrinomonadaceae bacterium]